MGLKYRPDIDGLRALAVIAVLVFHFRVGQWFSGGFAGVDVFFVISGFLISGMIFDRMDAGRYSILDFYDRRIRRIFPALFVVYAACVALSLLLQFPSEARTLSQALAASSLFVSNILFARADGYFDLLRAHNPLLHTWSLSIEEQFYLFFPLFVFAAARLGRKWRWPLLAAVALVSFVACTWMLGRAPSDAFYLMQYRAWELLAGALVACAPLPKATPRWLAEGLAAAGLTAILASLFLLDESMPFPGPNALGAVLGTAAVIFAGCLKRTATAQLLGLPPMRFFGLISYSLYLWHWPILIFASQSMMVDRNAKIVLILLSIAAATLSWRFIERPFRSKSWSVPLTLGAGAGAMAVAVIAAFSLGPLHQLHPTPARVTAMLDYDHYNASPHFRTGQCFVDASVESFSSFDCGSCLKIVTGKPNVLVYGDSHAAALWYGLQQRHSGIHFLQATAAGCTPVKSGTAERKCAALQSYILEKYLPAHRVDAIVVSGRWARASSAEIQESIAALRRFAPVVLVGPIAEYSPSLPRALAVAMSNGKDWTAVTASRLMPEPAQADARMALLHYPAGVFYVSAYDITAKNRCPLVDAKREPRQFDYGHLTASGSYCLAGEIGKALTPLLRHP